MIKHYYRLMDEAGAEGGEAGGGSGGAPAPFFESLQDEGLRTWAQTKGLKDAESAVKSAFNAEKLLGAPADQMLRLPSELTPETIKPLLARLGAPDSPDKYEVPTIEGVPADEGFTNWAKETFHKLGIPAATAKALIDEYNTFGKGRLDGSVAEMEAKFTADETALKKEWGNGYDRQLLIAKNAAQKLGFDEELLNAVEGKLGYAATMKFMANLGGKLGEDTFVNNQDGGKGGFHNQMTPAEAKAEWGRMLSDPDVSKSLVSRDHPAHKINLERKTRLFSIMYPEG